MPLPLSRTLELLESIAPLSLAESWDNVGLLLPPAGDDPSVSCALFAIDLTEAVLDEAEREEVDLVIAYHPVIFEGLKRLDARVPGHRVVARAVRAGLPVYCPHTALDAAPDGINDWLAEGLGAGDVRALAPAPRVPAGLDERRTGMGRHVTLSAPTPLAALVESLKLHLGKAHVRVAATARHAAGAPIRTAAVGAGASGSLFGPGVDVELLVTGEMRHHDVLAHVAAGRSVVLAEHTGTERGFLPRYARRLGELAGGAIETIVSHADHDPIVVA